MQKSPTRAVLVISGLAVLTIVVLTGFIIAEMRMRDGRVARAELIAIDTLLAEQTARAVESVDLVVSEVVEDLHQRGIQTAEELNRLHNDAATFQQLRQRNANLPQLEAITLISASGQLLNMSRYFPVPDVNISDREYYLRLRDLPELATTISIPVRNRGTGSWNIYLARRINAANGELVGMVLGAMRLEYFAQLYEIIGKAANTSVYLWREDGTLLAGYPQPGQLGQHIDSRRDLAGLPAGLTRVHDLAADLDGERHIVAAHKLLTNGLVLEVSQPTDDIYADWRAHASLVGLAGLGGMMVAGFVASALIRQFRAYAAMQAAVAAREEAVAARQRAEERLVDAQKMEAIGRLTSGIAHDFNNLLGSISGNAELLLRDATLGEKTSRRLSVIQQAAERGAALIRQMLAFARQQVLAPAAVSPGEALTAMTGLLEAALGTAMRLTITIEPALWPALVDPVQFEYMLLNLVVNARDAMPEGGQVTIAARRVPASDADRPEALPDGDFVAVSVTDTGVGMPKEILRKAFDPFFTTKPPGKGSGLGLSQVYGLATQSGGLVLLSSQPGAGTTVTVILPRADAATPVRQTSGPLLTD